MTEYDWNMPVVKRERRRGWRRRPDTQCPECGEHNLELRRKRGTDWSKSNIFDVLLPYRSAEKHYRLKWRCDNCSFYDSYHVEHDPVMTDEIEVYDPTGSQQTRLDQW